MHLSLVWYPMTCMKISQKSITQEAMDYINNNQEEAANILCKKEDVTAETMQEWLQDPGCVYDMKLPGVMDMANFMAENDFVDSAPESFEAITTESAR